MHFLHTTFIYASCKTLNLSMTGTTIWITFSLLGFCRRSISSASSWNFNSFDIVSMTVWKKYSTCCASDNSSRVISIEASPLSMAGNVSHFIRGRSRASRTLYLSSEIVSSGSGCVSLRPWLCFKSNTVFASKLGMYSWLFVILAAFVDETGQHVQDLGFQPGFVVEGKVVRSERQNPPHEPPLKIMERHHTPQGIVVQTDLEYFSFDIWTQCPNGPYHRQSFSFGYKIPLISVRECFRPEP